MLFGGKKMTWLNCNYNFNARLRKVQIPKDDCDIDFIYITQGGFLPTKTAISTIEKAVITIHRAVVLWWQEMPALEKVSPGLHLQDA